MASSILIIYTGGTIGMQQDAETGALKPFDFEHLLAEIPELRKFNYSIDSHSFKKPLDSSNMSPKTWAKLARLIETNYDNYDGFVVLHGSDTMAYSASALSFMLQNLSKPVILTGSQLPIGVIRTDGKENLITAIEIAAAKENGKPIVPEVAIYFEYQLYRGNRTTKISASHFEAFLSPNYPVIAEAGIDISYNHQFIKTDRNGELRLSTDFCNQVGVLKLYPGIHQSYVQSVLQVEDLKAVIIESYGAGNMPTDDWLLDDIKSAVQSGKKIINITQCLKGTVKQGSYETSKKLGKLGVISGRDMTIESAITKTMYLLGQGVDDFEAQFAASVCGE